MDFQILKLSNEKSKAPRDIRKYILDHPAEEDEICALMNSELYQRKEDVRAFLDNSTNGLFCINTIPGLGAFHIVKSIYPQFGENFIIYDHNQSIRRIEDLNKYSGASFELVSGEMFQKNILSLERDFICVDTVGHVDSSHVLNLFTAMSKIGFKKIIVLISTNTFGETMVVETPC